ncbi:MAG: hypothetical protein AAGF12_23410 [Myxococcota bacterium]
MARVVTLAVLLLSSCVPLPRLELVGGVRQRVERSSGLGAEDRIAGTAGKRQDVYFLAQARLTERRPEAVLAIEASRASANLRAEFERAPCTGTLCSWRLAAEERALRHWQENETLRPLGEVRP